MSALREKMHNDLRIRNLAENTQKSYLQSVTGLACYYDRSPDQLTVQEVQDYLLHLSQERHLAWKSCNTIRHGLRFLYRITLDRPATEFYLPPVPRSRRSFRRSSLMRSWCACSR